MDQADAQFNFVLAQVCQFIYLEIFIYISFTWAYKLLSKSISIIIITFSHINVKFCLIFPS